MTVNDLYNITKSIMFEKATSTTYDANLIANLNLVLIEVFEENNMCRYFKGKKALTEVPYVSTRNDELTYEDEYLHEVIPQGLAARFFIDDDLNKFSIFNTNYNNARVKNQKMVSTEKMKEIDNAV